MSGRSIESQPQATRQEFVQCLLKLVTVGLQAARPMGNDAGQHKISVHDRDSKVSREWRWIIHAVQPQCMGRKSVLEFKHEEQTLFQLQQYLTAFEVHDLCLTAVLRAGRNNSSEMCSDIEGFVTLSEDRTHFKLNGRPFFFSGANCYYLLVSVLPFNLQTCNLRSFSSSSQILQHNEYQKLLTSAQLVHGSTIITLIMLIE